MSSDYAGEMVNLVIDGQALSVPKGTNLIEAAKSIGIGIPYYCYHRFLSVAGNCRMCQVKIKGSSKLEVACNTIALEGMEVSTHRTSKEVAEAQAAILEFLLINHPLDCTVCDQAGHCKLQDYHFKYNARPSRMREEKVHKVKALPIGPQVILDGERCILCTRCVRFCDEVTKTSELGVFNRGDSSVIGVRQGHELDNPLSGTVVDLCPVGALTHRKWRFNTRIWFAGKKETVCPACSTGCNCDVYTRDNEIVLVKGRMNPEVNRGFMCDEGRYGFERFLPACRGTGAMVKGEKTGIERAISAAAGIGAGHLTVFASATLLLEEYLVLAEFLAKRGGPFSVVIPYVERSLTDAQRALVSPDYAGNYRGALFSGLVGGDLQAQYLEMVKRLKEGDVEFVLFVGNESVRSEDIEDRFLTGVSNAALSVAVVTDRESPLKNACSVVLPGRSILEKSGMFVNRKRVLQYVEKAVDPPEGSEAEWRIIERISKEIGFSVTKAVTDRGLTVEILGKDLRLAGLSVARIKAGGVLVGD